MVGTVVGVVEYWKAVECYRIRHLCFSSGEVVLLEDC